MSTKVTLIVISLTTIILSYFTFLKMKESSKQDFHVITWDKYNICFLVLDSFQIEKQNDGFKYFGGQNSGYLQLTQGKLSNDYKPSMIGDFKSGYKKVKNLRFFEYEIQDGVILKDAFDFAKKKPANIIPVRKNCQKYLENFPKLFDLESTTI